MRNSSQPVSNKKEPPGWPDGSKCKVISMYSDADKPASFLGLQTDLLGGAADANAAKRQKEDPYRRVYNLIRERQYDVAAKLIVRLWAEDPRGFFVYTSGERAAAADNQYSRLMKVTASEIGGRRVVIAPELAQRMLSNNPSNRPLKPESLAKWLRAMHEHDWALNGEAIIVARSGELNDGQHRLIACLITGQSFETFLNYGVERETRTTVDIGTKRTPGDRLHMQNVSAGKAKAAMAALIFEILYGRKPIDSERDSYFAEHESDFDQTYRLVGSVRCPGGNPSAFGAAVFYLLINGADITALTSFLKHLKTGENLKKGSSILALREGLGRQKMLDRVQMVKTVVNHYNSYRKGSRVGSLSMAAVLEKVERA